MTDFDKADLSDEAELRPTTSHYGAEGKEALLHLVLLQKDILFGKFSMNLTREKVNNQWKNCELLERTDWQRKVTGS